MNSLYGSHDRLFPALRDAALDIHQQVTNGVTFQVDQQEETITETMLLRLAMRQIPGYEQKTCSKNREGGKTGTGADWEWWWNGNSNWFGSAVQAKRASNGSYDFNYKSGSKDKGGADNRPLQRDLLRTYAVERGLPAIYCLYNGKNDLANAPDTRSCMASAGDLAHLGAGVLPLPVVDQLASSGTAKTKVRDALPSMFSLACLACPVRLRFPWRLPFWGWDCHGPGPFESLDGDPSTLFDEFERFEQTLRARGGAGPDLAVLIAGSHARAGVNAIYRAANADYERTAAPGSLAEQAVQWLQEVGAGLRADGEQPDYIAQIQRSSGEEWPDDAPSRLTIFTASDND